ncbi:hypothetical protein TNCV_3427511 [Trichonephila clavipes]|nr:hypothetical protein TNCV_3427511 [Trichonephila clavipes]
MDIAPHKDDEDLMDDCPRPSSSGSRGGAVRRLHDLLYLLELPWFEGLDLMISNPSYPRTSPHALLFRRHF